MPQEERDSTNGERNQEQEMNVVCPFDKKDCLRSKDCPLWNGLKGMCIMPRMFIALLNIEANLKGLKEEFDGRAE